MAARQEHKGVLHVQQKLQLAATAASLPALRARHLRQVRQKEAPGRAPQVWLRRASARVRVVPRSLHAVGGAHGRNFCQWLRRWSACTYTHAPRTSARAPKLAQTRKQAKVAFGLRA
jgi:hypothetical protein